MAESVYQYTLRYIPDDSNLKILPELIEVKCYSLVVLFMNTTNVCGIRELPQQVKVSTCCTHL